MREQTEAAKEAAMLSQETNAQKAPTSRVWKMREAIVNAPQEVSVQRARYLTASMKEHWAEPSLTRTWKSMSECSRSSPLATEPMTPVAMTSSGCFSSSFLETVMQASIL